MPKTKCLSSFVFASIFSAASLFAQDKEAEDVSPLVESESKEVEAPPAESATVGTKSFDAATVNELFETYKAENERAAEELAPHMNFDNLEVIELGAVNAQAYEVRNLDLLIEKLDPKPRQRLARLAELDPVAAANIQVTARSEERFFAGEHDYGTDMNAGSTANVDFRKVGTALSDALKKAKASMREKKATDDQAELPTGD
ncbi:hypothetical protein IEN85_20985 [Pelagicoccus sp. NFK12]|uniref:Uncharacterized protein n=1 Tax=Pelagicoccus enzymogenes TaxID=2773457 RepID=A0A927FBK9_9BACT|nr:hypothetical protein [Pelagicoccus enzymogenes]MBD5781987.1 hypothetical protein [Pelagicoccus enzymogenes]MDQ8196742.1 hypothetical protein [Pelagicoccus enzymogenes]